MSGRPSSSDARRLVLPAINGVQNQDSRMRSHSATEKRLDAPTRSGVLPAISPGRDVPAMTDSDVFVPQPEPLPGTASAVQSAPGLATQTMDPLSLIASLANCQFQMKENAETGKMEWTMSGVATDSANAMATQQIMTSRSQQRKPPRSEADGEMGATFPYYPAEADSDSDVDLGEEETDTKAEQLYQFEKLQKKVIKVIDAENANKKAVARNHKAVVAAHKKREADLNAEIEVLKSEAVEMRATIASLSDEVARLEKVELHLLRAREHEAMEKADAEHRALLLREAKEEAEEQRRRAEMARASFERELRELRNEIRSACEGVEEPLVMLRSLLGELCDKLRFDFASALSECEVVDGDVRPSTPTTRLVMANVNMFGELGSLVEALRGLLLLLGGLVGRPGADATDMPARELLSGAVTWAIGSSLPNCFAEVKGACEAVTATAAAMAERTSADGHAVQMLGEENVTLRERLRALEHFEQERDEAWAKVEVLQREVDNLLLEKKGMEERLSNQMATMEKMVDERIQVCNAMVKLQADQEAAEALRREATNMRADLEELGLAKETADGENKNLREQLGDHMSKLTKLREEHSELDNTCIMKQQRIEEMIDQRAEFENKIKPLQNLVEQLRGERQSLQQQLQEKIEQQDAGKAEMLALQQKLQAQVHVIDSLTSGSSGLQAKMNEQANSMTLLNQQTTDAARDLSDAHATINRLKEQLEEISGKERYKTQVNERLIQERSQLDHTISVLRQQLENAEGERKECVGKLKQQVHTSEQLATERTQLLRQLKQESETINKLSGVV